MDTNDGQLTVAKIRAALAVLEAEAQREWEPLVYLCSACGGWHQNRQEPVRDVWAPYLTPDCQWWQGQTTG